MKTKTTKTIRSRLKYLRGEIEAERISTGEILELQSLAKHIEPHDVLLLQWAGVPENRVAGVREDRRTGQFVPTLNGKDLSPTSFSEERALEIANQSAAKGF